MQDRKLITCLSVLLAGVLLSACNLGATPPPATDVGVIQTQAMQVVNTQFALGQTQTAAAAPPTSLPSFTPQANATRGTGTPFAFTPLALTPLTPIPTIATLAGAPAVSFPVGCNDAQFVGETKPFDNDEVKRDKEFSKGWQFLNVGTCTWDAGYAFIFREELSTPGLRPMIAVRDIKIGLDDYWTQPGHENTFVVKIKPDLVGEYKGVWQMKGKDGNFFGSQVYVLFVVVPPD